MITHACSKAHRRDHCGKSHCARGLVVNHLIYDFRLAPQAIGLLLLFLALGVTADDL